MEWLLEQQRLQFAHDATNHQDIHCLSRADRLKHYGLHFAKYCGRLARDGFEQGADKTLADWFLVALSASIALQDKLVDLPASRRAEAFEGAFVSLCDASGRFCDACEKIDHLEEFRAIATVANRDIVLLLLGVAAAGERPLDELLRGRRGQLAERAFYS